MVISVDRSTSSPSGSGALSSAGKARTTWTRASTSRMAAMAEGSRLRPPAPGGAATSTKTVSAKVIFLGLWICARASTRGSGTLTVPRLVLPEPRPA